MDNLIDSIHMLFHPLLELDQRYIEPSSMIKREHINLLSYNIFLRPPPVKNNESDWKDERLIDFIKLLDNFDIICLQEMFGTLTSRRQELIKYANKSGLFFFADVPSPSFFSKGIIDAGLLILSRFPIIESQFKPFKFTVLNCQIVEKGVLYVKIKIRDANLVIFNVHLQSTYFDTTEEQWEICTDTRMSHLEELSAFIASIINDRKINEKDTILLMGDFNIDAHNLKYKLEKLEQLGKKFTFIVREEYKAMLEILNKDKFKAADLWMKNPVYENVHPFTYGVTGDENSPQYDKVLTDQEDINCHQTLDYIFEILTGSNETDKKITIDYNSIKTNELLIDNKPYQQLSDHFAVGVDLHYKDSQGKMLMQSDKLSSKNRQTVNEITKNLTNVLTKIQESDSQLKGELENLKIENANEISVGSDKRCYLVQVNEASVKSLHKVHSDIVQKLEEHFSTPVVIVPFRKKINGKLFRKYIGTKVPREKTLSAVYDSYLEDLLYPATIVGKRTRFPKGKSRLFKVYVDPLDREAVEYKTAAIVACYKGLTNRDLVIEFPQNY